MPLTRTSLWRLMVESRRMMIIGSNPKFRVRSVVAECLERRKGSLRSASLTDQVVGLLSEGLPQLSCEHSHVPIETSSTLVDRAAAGDVLGGAGRLDGPGHTKRSWASDQ